jgi:hypothetical protein
MSFVAFMLKRPYTVISGLILIALLGIGAVSRMPPGALETATG